MGRGSAPNALRPLRVCDKEAALGPAGSSSFPKSGRVQLVFILEQVLNGLLVGAYYLLIALGLSLIFALGGIVNLAHGGFYAIGAYLAVILGIASDSQARSSPHRWRLVSSASRSSDCCFAASIVPTRS